MRWSDVIALIKEQPPAEGKTNANGFPIKPKEIKRKVFANKKSVGYNEYLRSYEVGLSADMLFDVHTADYNGEGLLEYEGKRYRIYKTYVSKNGEITELKATGLSERGVNGGKG